MDDLTRNPDTDVEELVEVLEDVAGIDINRMVSADPVEVREEEEEEEEVNAYWITTNDISEYKNNSEYHGVVM